MQEIILATLGPSSHDIGTIKELIKAGATHFRLNMSHGTISDHKTLILNRSSQQKPKYKYSNHN